MSSISYVVWHMNYCDHLRLISLSKEVFVGRKSSFETPSTLIPFGTDSSKSLGHIRCRLQLLMYENQNTFSEAGVWEIGLVVPV